MFLAIDYGRKRIGLAIGEMFPRGMGVVDGSDQEKAIDKIAFLVKENRVQAIVLGMPTRFQGGEGTLASEIKEFGQKLASLADVPIYFEPETLTSFEAAESLKTAGFRHDKLEIGKIDETAAIIILESFLAAKNWQKEEVKPDILPKHKDGNKG